MKKLLLVLTALSAVIFTLACQQKQTTEKQPEATALSNAPAVIDSATAAKIKEELTDSMMKYAQMWDNKDINALSDLWVHDPDVTFIPPGTHDRLVGFDAVMKYYQDSFDSMDKIDFKISDLLIKLTPDGNTAVITYYVQNDYTDKATGKPGKKNSRVCVVKTKVDGQWKMIHADSSVSVAEMMTMAKSAPAKKVAPKK